MTVTLKVGNSVALSATAMNPESTPAFKQGAAKLDWVTEWFFWWLVMEIGVNRETHNRVSHFGTHNSKEMVSRGGMLVRKGGSKIKEPFALPTTTVWTLPVNEAGVAAGEPGYDA